MAFTDTALTWHPHTDAQTSRSLGRGAHASSPVPRPQRGGAQPRRPNLVAATKPPGFEPSNSVRSRRGKCAHSYLWATRRARKGQEGSRSAPRSLLGTLCKMATPSLRGRLARFANPGKPVLKPNKPLILANCVGNRRRERGEATCITEMSIMMACWKQNEFRDEACRKEIQDFFDCSSRAQEARKMRSNQESLGQSENLPPHKMTKLLQRFPNKSHLS